MVFPVPQLPDAPGETLARAARLRDLGKGRVVTFSPKVFIPLTRLCRDVCGYCTFRRTPQRAQAPFLELEEVICIAEEGERFGCREALFVLGERPEERYQEARRWLRRRGHSSTIDYLATACRAVLEATALIPHSNAGNLSRSEIERLAEVNASLGLMLESASKRLGAPGGPHEHAPSKSPDSRLKTLRAAGEAGVAMTTGILIGIGESRPERLQALSAIGDLHRRYGNIQEVIVQNFRPKPKTAMRDHSQPSMDEMLEAIAEARLLLGPGMNVQAPPNLAPDGEESCLAYLDAGINDLGGISPVTIDWVNPEAPWPHLGWLAQRLAGRGFQLKARFPVYPEFYLHSDGFVPSAIRRRLLAEADRQGHIAHWRRPVGPIASASCSAESRSAP